MEILDLGSPQQVIVNEQKKEKRGKHKFLCNFMRFWVKNTQKLKNQNWVVFVQIAIPETGPDR
jgi:hypothetical protein